ncbi:50S ribosomal L2 domain protein [Mycobacterium xenopi 4042]|uniref:50S ribosomal L2 domain protein n=1 Tax=Mycobacterium xenopi 4042 TaxID=1299334 RepID=X7YLE3_MYCXE|nr:50S ribosomal L2 domain protein [Mycobacterium xenopi 4042]
MEGQAAVGAWCGDEPGGPPARWWRGQVLGWPSPGQPVGQAEGRTRRRHKLSDKLIVRRRRTGKKHSR